MSIILTKNGQLKIQQMIFMLIAVTLLFVLIVLFYLGYKFVNLEQSVTDLKREKATGLVTKIASSPELNFEERLNAIDSDKLMILRNKRDYKDYWGIDGIIVKKLYPANTEDIECKLGNYPECNLIKVFTDKSQATTGSYVALCRKQEIQGYSTNKCELALLMIDIKENE